MYNYYHWFIGFFLRSFSSDKQENIITSNLWKFKFREYRHNIISTEKTFTVSSNISKKMTLKEKIAQMFFVRCPESHALQFVKTYQVGGYILFGRDFEGKTRNEVI